MALKDMDGDGIGDVGVIVCHKRMPVHVLALTSRGNLDYKPKLQC